MNYEKRKQELELEITKLEAQRAVVLQFQQKMIEIKKQLEEDINAEKKKGFFSWFFD